jgi:hypothetical protein
MKNLAICISGSLRSLEYCLKNFITNIIEPNENQMNIIIFYYIPNDANSKKIEFLKENLQNKYKFLYLIKDDISLPIPNIIWNGRPSSIVIDSVSSGGLEGYLQQLYGVEQCYLLMKEYEQKNNINFDYILRVRNDVIFKNNIFLNNLIGDKIIVPDFHYWTGINDRFAFGKKNLMIVYMQMYSNLYKIVNHNHVKENTLYLDNAEYFCKINLLFHNISYKHENILFNRVRMNGNISNDSF